MNALERKAHKLYKYGEDSTFLYFASKLIDVFKDAEFNGYPKEKIDAFKYDFINFWKNQNLKNIVTYWFGLGITLTDVEKYCLENMIIPAYPNPESSYYKDPMFSEEFYDNYFDTLRRYKNE